MGTANHFAPRSLFPPFFVTLLRHGPSGFAFVRPLLLRSIRYILCKFLIGEYFPNGTG